MPALDVVLVLLFVLVGGFFAASELALVNLREGQVRRLAEDSRRGAAVARLRADPNRLLSSVQVGVTLSGFLASAYGGATLAEALEAPLGRVGVPAPGTVALVGVTLLVAYASLVLGELVPKRLALQRSAAVAVVVAPVLDRVAVLTRPVIWLLGRSTDVAGRLVGLRPGAEEEAQLSEEELRDAVLAHADLEPEERRLLDDVFAAGDRRVSEVMVPRPEVTVLRGELTVDAAVEQVLHLPWSRYPVVRGGSPDDVVGVVHLRDLLTAVQQGRGAALLADVARPLAAVPESLPALRALELLREQRAHLALVVDEYGGTAGVVTLEDVLEELVGEIEDEFDRTPRPVVDVAELDGLLHRDEVRQATGVQLPHGPFDTLGGFVQDRLERVPAQGDAVELDGHRFTVTALDGLRVSRVRVDRLEGPH